MKLAPREVEKLLLHNAGYVAQKRLARGIRLNYTESVALIASQILEFVRDGDKSVAELMDVGRQLLGRRQVLPTVPHLLESVQVEGTFSDGTKLITVHEPISCENGNLDLALHGSFLPVPSLEKFPIMEGDEIPGELMLKDGSITLNLGRDAVILKVTNDGDRPIQVGSHYHFIEVNPCLIFDRRKAYGMRLNIPAGTATRFEPGDAKSVTLVRICGRQVIRGEYVAEETEQLRASVDFLVDLCDTISSPDDANFANWSYQAVDFILDAIKNILSKGKNIEPVEGIVGSLSLRLVKKMCTTLQGNEVYQVHNDAQFHIQHLLRKLGSVWAGRCMG